MYSVKGSHLETVQSLLKFKSLRCDYQNKVCVCAVNECVRVCTCAHVYLFVVVCVCVCAFTFLCVLTKLLCLSICSYSNLHVMCCAQAGQTVYHIVAATYNAKDIAEELLHLDCPLDTPDEDVSIAREIVTHMHICSKGIQDFDFFQISNCLAMLSMYLAN